MTFGPSLSRSLYKGDDDRDGDSGGDIATGLSTGIVRSFILARRSLRNYNGHTQSFMEDEPMTVNFPCSF